ncbi:hypothetical protein BG261_05325 [Floricoccus tropicus]|uniref:Uncharacterized protein n=1 Tax=Floricoccus tropicus TaxID=1859473 RepID=A0A1E8GKN8_9LACT|nr:phage tail protein [Floricoccus tropicus]OFI48811.1 hypothetical protein BG261_05325 [Floricoccus tropicus]
MYVRDLQLNEYPVMGTYTISDEINGDMNLSIEILPNKVNSLFLDKIAEFWELVDDNEEVYKIVLCKSQGVGKFQKKTIKALPKLYDDLDSTRVYERYDGSFPIEELFNICFKPTSYTHKLIGAWNNIKIEGYGDGDTCLKMFQHVLNRVGAEFTFTGNVVTIRDRIGTDSNVMYRHRLNASNIIKEVDGQSYWTYGRGFGNYEDSDEGAKNAKLKREYTSPLAKLLGKREAPPLKDGRMKDSATMDKSLKKLVDESIKISVTADLVDLREKGYPYAQSNLGDTVLLIDERIGLNEEVRVVSRQITRNWLGKILDLKFTFGTEGLVKRYQGKMSNAVNNITDILEGRKKLPFQAMSDEIQIVTKLLKSVQTQFVFGDDGSMIAIDKKNPNLIVILNAAGVGISDDGGQTFKNAITGRGILADAIMANSITADKLDVNAITVGFNNSSTNIKLYSDRIQFFKNSKMNLNIDQYGMQFFKDGVKTAVLNDDGMEFWYGTRKIGRLGTSSKSSDANIRGVTLRLEDTGDYLGFLYKKATGDTTYTSALTIDPKGKFYSGFSGMTVDVPMRMINSKNELWTMDDVLAIISQFKGLGSVAIATSFDSNGAATKWHNLNL